MRDFDYISSIQRLRFLVGESFSGVGRAATLGVLSFGSEVSVTNHRTRELMINSKYAVHVQCPFRVSRSGFVLLGSDDMSRAAKSTDEGLEIIGPWTAFDVAARALDTRLQEARVSVVGVDLRPPGDLRIEIEADIAVEIFPASGSAVEAWRFLERGGEHLVFPNIVR